MLPAIEFELGLLKRTQVLLPVGFEPAGDQPILRLNGTVTALGTFGLVTCPLDGNIAVRVTSVPKSVMPARSTGCSSGGGDYQHGWP